MAVAEAGAAAAGRSAVQCGSAPRFRDPRVLITYVNVSRNGNYVLLLPKRVKWYWEFFIIN